tara:strand:- start:2646 stop:3014 length:369 start_codon:yes stop_codon:yes gene_type:complete
VGQLSTRKNRRLGVSLGYVKQQTAKKVCASATVVASLFVVLVRYLKNCMKSDLIAVLSFLNPFKLLTMTIQEELQQARNKNVNKMLEKIHKELNELSQELSGMPIEEFMFTYEPTNPFFRAL